MIDVLQISSSDPDEGHAALDRIYGTEVPIRYSGSTEQFALDARCATADALGADRIRHTMSARAVMHSPGLFVAAIGTGGALSLRSARSTVEVVAGAVARLPTTSEDGHYEWSDVAVSLVRIPMAAIHRLAAERCDTPRDAFRFTGLAAVSPAAARQWRLLADYVHREMAGDRSIFSAPLVQRQVVDLVAATALTVFPNTATGSDDRPGPGYAGPASVRRAVEFMVANVSAPITMTDVATVAGVSARALQTAFRRHHASSPMEYLRDLRLDAAHRELQASDPATGVTVAAVAMRWGFSHAARFTGFYRARFGVTPSRTLHG